MTESAWVQLLHTYEHAQLADALLTAVDMRTLSCAVPLERARAYYTRSESSMIEIPTWPYPYPWRYRPGARVICGRRDFRREVISLERAACMHTMPRKRAVLAAGWVHTGS